MINLIKDDKGFVSLIDALFAVLVLFMILMTFNMLIDMDIPSLSQENNDFKTGQDIMEIMSSKVDGRDYALLEKISYVLSEDNNSVASKRKVKSILDDFFSDYLENDNHKYNYAFLETNQLNGEVLSSNGDYADADRVIVVGRNFGNYSYKLYLF